jgi:hypothetical protein
MDYMYLDAIFALVFVTLLILGSWAMHREDK